MRFFFLALPLLVFGELSLEEKIGQLFVAPISPLHNQVEDWKELISKYSIENAIIYKSDVESQIQLLNRLRPLFVMADIEWGLSMRMNGAPEFPKNMALGAIGDLSLIEQMGAEIAREAKLMGIHMSLGPVVDVNNNPKNPIIHMRSFGDDPEEVGRRAAAMIRGMHRGGLRTCIKHFPGHGDTEIDSHWALPTIPHSIDRLNEIELPPFLAGIAANSDAVMTAHILIPELDTVPATLSYPIVTNLLREALGFDGLVITDALNMKALTNHYSVEDIALRAHAAGADLLLYGDCKPEVMDELIRDQIPRAYAALLKAYQTGQFPMSRLDESVHRILKAKEGMPNEPLAPDPKLTTPETTQLQEALYSAIITRLGPNFAPIDPDTGYLSVEGPEEDPLTTAFCPCACLRWEDRHELFDYPRAVVSVFGFQFSEEQRKFFQELSEKMEVAYCLFGSPYLVNDLPVKSTIFLGFEVNAQKSMLDVLTGQRDAQGHSPVLLKSLQKL